MMMFKIYNSIQTLDDEKSTVLSKSHRKSFHFNHVLIFELHNVFVTPTLKNKFEIWASVSLDLMELLLFLSLSPWCGLNFVQEKGVQGLFRPID